MRNLSLLGKITIFKTLTLTLSNIVHLVLFTIVRTATTKLLSTERFLMEKK